MSQALFDRLAGAPVVPLVQATDPSVAVSTARALHAGGLTVVEVVLRTPEALDCLAAIVNDVPEVIAGAGTVLNADQAEASVERGAAFIVSPGLDDGVVAVSRDAGRPVLPGVSTASEAQKAFNLGLDTVKFFPASIAGGVPAIKALGSVFRGMKFMPTGGISPSNLAEYLALPSVLACGGSWLTPADAIAANDFPAITRLATDALERARAVRP